MNKADQLTELFRERFAGHEMEAPAGAWEHISGQLAAGSGEGLRDILQEKFQGHEVDVDPSAWAHISGQLGQAGATGTGLGAGWIAAGIAAVALTAGLLLWGGGAEEAHPVTGPMPTVEQTETPAPAAEAPLPETPAPSLQETAIAQVQEEPRAAAPAPATAPVPENREVVKEVPETDVDQVATEDKPTTEAERTIPVVPAATATSGPVQDPHKDHAPSPGGSSPEPKAGPVTETVGSTGQEDAAKGTVPETESIQQAPPPVEETVVQQKVFIPNVFTPQGDGINDLLEIVVSDYESVDVKVFSTKNGTLVFHTNDLSEQWDGRLPNGNSAEEGHYQCVVRVTFNDGRSRTKTELVRLYR